MINKESAKEIKIKRANTDWWINEKAVVGDNGKTYIAYVTDMGEIHVKEIDARCSKTPSQDYRLCKMNCNYADEHNAPSICIMESGKIMVAYTGHAATHTLKYRITERPYDLSSFGPEIALPYEGSVTYVQLFENTVKKELWLFCRVSSVTWEFIYSKDEGKTWSKPKTFLVSKDGGLFYFNLRKQWVKGGPTGVQEQWFFALYGHPRISKDHTIRSGIFDENGQLLKTDGTPTTLNLYEDDGQLIELPKLDTVYASPEGTTVRLLEVAPTLPLRVAFAPFVLDDDRSPDPEKPTYYSATFMDGKWQISEPICQTKEFLAKDILDGSQTYLGGMAYYYGVGEAGRNAKYYGDGEVGGTKMEEFLTNRIFVARFDGEYRLLESYITADYGKSYQLEQVIKKIPKEENVKIWRPIVPIHAQDNLQVYWHEGQYYAHTGGWHCDTVMLVEYDD